MITLSSIQTDLLLSLSAQTINKTGLQLGGSIYPQGEGSLRMCLHKSGALNYPEAMITLGQALPSIHIIICCHGSTSLLRGKLITTN